MTTHMMTLIMTLPMQLQGQVTILPAAVDGDVKSSGVLGLSLIDNAINSTSRSGGSNVVQSLYEFDISGIASHRLIEEAYFEFDTRLLANTSSTAVFRIDGYVGDGVITTDDYDSGEATGGDLLASYLLVNADDRFRSLSLALTDFSSLQDAIANDESYYGLRTETNNFATIQVSSLENTFDDAVPSLRLVLTPIPEPSSMSLVLIGCLGLFARRR